MAIFAVLAGIGGISVMQYLSTYEKKAATRMIISDLIKARIHAIKQRTPQTFKQLNTIKYRIENANDATDILITRDFKDDYGWKGVTFESKTEPTFNIDGTINNISTIEVNPESSDPISITMTITGNIKIAE